MKINGRNLTVSGEGRPNHRVYVYEGERLETTMKPIEAERFARALLKAAKEARATRSKARGRR